MGLTAKEVLKQKVEARRLIASYIGKGRVGDKARNSLMGMGVKAADALLEKYCGDVLNGDSRIGELMVEIAARNPTETKSVEMMEAVGKHLSKKKSKKKNGVGRDDDKRLIVALKRRYREVARLMGGDTEKRGLVRRKITKQEGKKETRAANNAQ